MLWACLGMRNGYKVEKAKCAFKSDLTDSMDQVGG